MLYSKGVRFGSVSARWERKMHKVFGAVLACSLTAGVFAQNSAYRYRPFRIPGTDTSYLAFGGSTVLLKSNEIWTKATGKKVIPGGSFNQVSPLGSVLGTVNAKPAMLTPQGDVVMLPESAPDGTPLGRSLYQRRDGTIVGLTANELGLYWIAPGGTMKMTSLPSKIAWGRTWASPDGRLATNLGGPVLRTFHPSRGFRSYTQSLGPVYFGTEDMRFRFPSAIVNWDGVADSETGYWSWNNTGSTLANFVNEDRTYGITSRSTWVHSSKFGSIQVGGWREGFQVETGLQISDNDAVLAIGLDARNPTRGLYVAEPVPEPSTAVAALVGLGLLKLRRQRTRTPKSLVLLTCFIVGLTGGASATPRFERLGFRYADNGAFVTYYGAVSDAGHCVISSHWDSASIDSHDRYKTVFWQPGYPQLGKELTAFTSDGEGEMAISVNSQGLMAGYYRVVPVFSEVLFGMMWSSPTTSVNPNDWIRWDSTLASIRKVTDTGWIAGNQYGSYRPLVISPQRVVYYFDHLISDTEDYAAMFLNNAGNMIYLKYTRSSGRREYFLWSPTQGTTPLGTRQVLGFNNRNEMILREIIGNESSSSGQTRLWFRNGFGQEFLLKTLSGTWPISAAGFSDSGDLFYNWTEPSILNINGTEIVGPFFTQPRGSDPAYRINSFLASNNSGQLLARIEVPVPNYPILKEYFFENLQLTSGRFSGKPKPVIGFPTMRKSLP